VTNFSDILSFLPVQFQLLLVSIFLPVLLRLSVSVNSLVASVFIVLQYSTIGARLFIAQPRVSEYAEEKRTEQIICVLLICEALRFEFESDVPIRK